MSKKPNVPVVKTDWKTVEMPESHDLFSINRKFTEEEMENLKYGFLPQEMEDKWFWYFEEGKLYIHRSWTGFCIYIAAFSDDPQDSTIQVTVNRDPSQYTCTDSKTDSQRLNLLLDIWCRRKHI